MKINLGSGRKPLEGHVNVDQVKLPGVDVIADLDVAPWPFKDACAEFIAAWHVFEHVADPCMFMTECHRILRPGGQLEVISPLFAHFTAFVDPTHRRFCAPETWDFWVPGTTFYDPDVYGYAPFERTEVGLVNDRAYVRVALRKLAGRWPRAEVRELTP